MIGNLEATSTTVTSTSLRSLSLSTRYHGMIEESLYKKIRNSLFVLFDYIAQTAPPLFAMHSFISVWRIIQFIGASLVANNKYFWGHGTVMDKVSDIVCIIFHILPSSVRKENAIYILYIFIGLFALIFVFVGASAYYFQTKQKLQKWITITISVIFATIGYIFPPIAVNFTGEIIGRMITNPNKEVTALNMCGVIFSILILLAYLWIFNSIYAVSIIFRPDSLMTIIPSVQTLIVMSNLLITFILGLASELSKLACVIISFVAAVVYIASNMIYYQKGGMVHQGHLKAMTATATAGGILLVVVGVFMLLNQIATEVILVIYIAVWLLCYVFFSFYVNRRTSKIVYILDSLEEDVSNYETIRSARKLSDYVVTGFRVAHPACLSWKLFKFGIEQWPTSIDNWLLYAKFIAIYPEETQQLAFISIGMVQNHLKGTLAKHCMSQIQSIMKQRESNLATDLKVKLDKIGKQIQQTKHKVRYIWDLILQGNIKEIEACIQHAYIAIENCEAEFYHLLRQYPNNRFVARTYARFLRDVVADHAAHKQWAQNVSSLQRGVAVVSDQAHDLGIRAFPLLPKNVETTLQTQTQTQGVLTDDTLTQEIDADDEQAAIDAELRVSVRDSINSLKIPSFKEARIIRIFSWTLFFFIPIIALLIYTPYYIQMVSQPIEFIFQLSNIRNLIFQATAFVHHYACENIKNAKEPNHEYYPLSPPSDIEDIIEDPPISFGGTFDTKKQVMTIIKKLSDAIPELAPLMSFKTNNEQMNKIRQKFFEPNTMFVYYEDPIQMPGFTNTSRDPSHLQFNYSTSGTSIQSAAVQFVIYTQDIIDYPEIPEDILTRREISILINNLRMTTNEISGSLETFRHYVVENDKDLKLYLNIANIIVCIVIPLIYILFGYIIYHNITRDKTIIYKCLTSLPKNVVSRVADSFKVLKKDEDDEMKSRTNNEELNKQEENMLKIFATSSDSGSGNASDLIIVIAITTLVLGLFIAYACTMLQYYVSSSTQLMRCSPHIDFLTATYSYDLASMILFNMLPGSACPFILYNIVNFKTELIIDTIFEWQAKAAKVYAAIRYGDDSLDAVPFQSLGINIDAGLVNANCDGAAIPENKHQIYDCWTADLLYSFVQMQVKSQAQGLKEKGIIYNGTNYYLTHLWHIHQYHLYDNYFGPRFENIVEMVMESMNKKVPMNTGIVVAILIFALILEILFLKAIQNSEDRQKFALRLLLHCPGNIVVSNQSITAILAGNFKVQHIDSTTRGAEFYDVLVKDMPDCVVILDLEGKIRSANKSTKRIFGIEEEELVGNHINMLGEKFTEGNPFATYFDVTVASEEKNFEKKFTIQRADGTQVHLEVIFSVLPENLLVIVRDITQTVMYNQLIGDERAKSDQLLSSILPARLVPRVQAGEKNISFAVQSATILFMDICSFTPWCGSLPASKVMSTLNRLFKEYDSLVAMHPTITKIKCIGDCYMCAGGIFAEVNQPAAHAKDVVEFGLDSIEALVRVNKDIDQDLKMRVGINTGGPIVAGVLGTEKPTFEILGPTINMAQQMEHHGVPMKVHVSRAVYELIYGGNFIVKERGEIEIKNGTVVTYLIDKKPA